MIVRRLLLFECVVAGCGHRFQAWNEYHEDGQWEAHFHAECGICKSIVESVHALMFPSAPIVQED
jgi:hypothetical protein